MIGAILLFLNLWQITIIISWKYILKNIWQHVLHLFREVFGFRMNQQQKSTFPKRFQLIILISILKYSPWVRVLWQSIKKCEKIFTNIFSHILAFHSKWILKLTSFAKGTNNYFSFHPWIFVEWQITIIHQNPSFLQINSPSPSSTNHFSSLHHFPNHFPFCTWLFFWRNLEFL